MKEIKWEGYGNKAFLIMSYKEIVFFLEGASEENFLKGFLGQHLKKNIERKFIKFEGKQDLLKTLENKMCLWTESNTYFFILVDQDNNDCKELKNELLKICQKTKKAHYDVCIACRVLENWYLGNLSLVSKVYKKDQLINNYNKSPLRNAISGDGLDSLDGYKKLEELKIGYQKIAGSRELGKIFTKENNASLSFKIFCKKIDKINQFFTN